MAFRPIKVLLVDSSRSFGSAMRKDMSGDKGIGDVRVVPDLAGALQGLKSYRPDVIISSAELPDGTAADLIRSLPDDRKVPVVVVGQSKEEAEKFLRAGAADFVVRPGKMEGKLLDAFCSEICVRMKIATAPKLHLPPSDLFHQPAAPPVPAERALGPGFASPYRVILIGASTGGTDATAEIIKRLPGNLPGIVIVQHMPPVFTRMYAQRLDALSEIRVREAGDRDRVENGTALVAPGGLQMLLKKDALGYYVTCVSGERVNGHCPSVGVLFDSAAKAAGKEAIGVILTGMGKDGAEGLLHMRNAGAFTIGQDQETCVVYGMPMVAKEIGAVMQQVPIEKIADAILQKLD